jgi:hypothetical protein
LIYQTGSLRDPVRACKTLLLNQDTGRNRCSALTIELFCRLWIP